MADSEPENFDKKRQTSTKLRHFGSGFLTVAQAAAMLGKNAVTVKRWCESGKLPAIAKPYGKSITYQISPQALELLIAQEQASAMAKVEKQKKLNKPHSEWLPAWIKAMEKGLINGRAFSPNTIASYELYVGLFFKKHLALTIDTLKTALAAIAPESVAVREKTFKALVCFGKFLVMQSALDETFLAQAKPLCPKYHKPPKRHTVQADELDRTIAACETLQEKALLLLTAGTGIRASELCALTLADIHADEGFLLIQRGKGGKQRRVGLSQTVLDALSGHLSECHGLQADSTLFLNADGNPMNRFNLYQLLKRIGKRAGVTAHPHALRRAFVTINANKGRPLQMLQMACGHAKITTTMSYCRTSEQEVIDAMREWD